MLILNSKFIFGLTFLFKVLSEKHFNYLYSWWEQVHTHIYKYINAGEKQVRCDGSTEDLIVTDKMHCIGDGRTDRKIFHIANYNWKPFMTH